MKRFVAACALASMSTAMFLVGPTGFASAAKTAGGPATVKVSSAPRVPQGARRIGAVAAAASVRGDVVLQPRDNAAVTSFIAAVTNPRSPQFHQYLQAGEFASRFGPTSATINAVRSRLAADGLRVTGISSDGILMSFSGSARTVGKAFGTGLASYRLADGSTGQATTTAITVPSALAGKVAAVIVEIGRASCRERVYACV